MRSAIAILCFASLSSAAVAQNRSEAQDIVLRVRTLTIVSSELPDSERMQIVSAYQGKTYYLEELKERIRQDLRDLGYANAAVEDGQLANLSGPPDSRSADVAVRVFPGAKYQVEAIRFTGAKAFSPDQLRSQFPIADGSLFNATAIGKGLEKLKSLYVSNGYADFGCVPKLVYDEERPTIALTLDLDEGRRYFFGRLFFDGVEPHAGAVQALRSAWKQLEGKVYDPQAVIQWVNANAPYLRPAADATPEQYVANHANPEAHQIDIVLQFPDVPPQSP